MDHLPYPDEASIAPLKIPYLCANVEQYDGQGFEDFPQRKGWINHSPWSVREDAQTQSWLYFGLLAELFGSSFNENDFIEFTMDGDQHITTRGLPAILKDRCQETSRFYQRMASAGFRDRSQEGFLRGRPYLRLNERVKTALKVAQEQSDLLDAKVPAARLITLSIKILIWSICNALGTYLPSRKALAEIEPGPSRFLRSRMIEGKKCPYWTEVYLQRYSAAMNYYLAATPPLDGKVDHGRCSARQCTAHDIDEQRYTTKHVQHLCHCEMVTPNVDKIADIIEETGIPLVRFRILPSGDLALDVVQGQYGQNYTAISHVWSGGLGNPSSNSLPQCQLRNIRRGLKRARRMAHEDAKLYPHGNSIYKYLFHNSTALDEVFWMDTLCIPVGRGKILRRKAVTQMNFIFAGADNVLVIDPGLQTVQEKSVSKLQLRSQVTCSPWMSRCWTFQEARLARAWHIYLRSTLYEPARDHGRETDPLYRIEIAKSVWTDESELEREAISFYGELWPLIDQRPGYRPSFRGLEAENVEELARIWGQLDERSTTRRGDRLIILAILLDLNPGEISSLDISQQMRAILRTQDILPLSLMFKPQCGPTADETKCRWIPLFPRGNMTTAYGCMVMDRDSSFYKFTLSGINAIGFVIDVNDLKHRQFRIKQDTPCRFSAWVRVPLKGGVSTAPTCSTYCIILSQIKGQSKELGPSLVGARFAVNDLNSDRKLCRVIYDCPLEYSLDMPTETMSGSVTGNVPIIETSTSLVGKKSPLITGEWHQVEAKILPGVTEFLVDCDLPNWYVPHFSRARTMGLRRHVGLQTIPYVGLISGLILAIWLLSVSIGTLFFALATFKQTLDLSAEYTAFTPLILLGIAFLRTTVWHLAEYHRMMECVGERQYYNWMNTFGASNDSATPAAGIGNTRLPSYQYRPWWLAVVIIVCSLGLLIVGIKVRVMVWATVPAATLLAETVIRVVLEQLWLRTRLGRIGKQLRLKWLPWLSIPIRQY